MIQKKNISHLVFIDSNVEDCQSLISGVSPNAEVIILDETRDGIEQITERLAIEQNIEAIHIISHGSPGAVQLGSITLNSSNIESFGSQLKQWRKALIPGADILLYGCNVAAINQPWRIEFAAIQTKSAYADYGISTRAGGFSLCSSGFNRLVESATKPTKPNQFLQRLSELTGASVAASKKLTGSAAKGGDWELEVRTGEIKTPLVFEPEVLAAYEYVLSTFGAATNFGVGTNPKGINIGDFNADTFPDLVVTNQNDDNISILLGNGTGGFDTATNFAVGSNPVSVTSGLFNNDNFPDLAVVNSSSNISTVSILLGDGTGNFIAGGNFNAGYASISVAVGNFNADNFLDLAVVNADPVRPSGSVSIFLGTGTGSFGAATNFNVGNVPGSVVVGDFNADIFLDLAVSNSGQGGSVSILLGNGTGGFGAATNVGAVPTPQSIATGDFNGDTYLDLATVNASSNSVSILLGNGIGGFGTATDLSAGAGLNGIVVKDFSGDGRLDLAVTGTSGAAILVGNGNGGFSTPINFAAGTSPTSIIAGNFNADTLLDLAVANNGSDNVSVLLNTPNTVNFGAATYSETEGTTDTVVNIPITISGGTPFADVTVPIAIDPSSTATENSDYTISPTTVTFPAGSTGAALTQNVAVTIKPDNIAENAETAILNLGTITGGVAGTTKQTTLTIAANGTVSYAVAAGIASIPEGNSGTIPLTFTVTRSGGSGVASSVNYAIAGTATNISDYNNIGGTSGATGTTGTIDFAAGETSKTITLDVLGDSAIEPDETVTVTLSNPVAPGATPTITADAATTTVTNDDTAGFTVNTTSTNATEGGATGSYSVKLNTQPTAPVTISFDTGSQINPISSINFDSTNWNVTQTIAVVAVDDNLVEGNHTGAIAPTATSSDVNYNGITMEPVSVAITDNDTTPTPTPTPIPSLTPTPTLTGTPTPTSSVTPTPTGTPTPTATGTPVTPQTPTPTLTPTPTVPPGTPAVILIQPLGSTDVLESFGNDIYKVRLNTQPTANVTVAITPGNQVTVSQPALTFTPANWNVAQTLRVTAVDDAVVEGDRVSAIAHVTASADTLYNNLAASLTVNISDNDNPGDVKTLSQKSVIGLTDKDDRITGSALNDIIYARPGNDGLDGKGGDDLLYGQKGDDGISGGDGNDIIFGGQGIEFIKGDRGTDLIYGGKENDRIFGGDGDDLLFGDAGNDYLFGEMGADTLTGGLGNDVFAIAIGTGGTSLAAADVITDFTINQDKIDLISPLTFNQLNISQGTGLNIADTIIQYQVTGEYLAVLKGVTASSIVQGVTV